MISKSQVGEVMQYIKVDRRIEQVVTTSSFLAKVKGQDKKIMTLLEAEYEKDVSNLENTVALCFYQWFLADDKLDLADTNSVFQVTFDVINKLEDTLEIRPEYWLLWILKFKIISFMNFNEYELIEDLLELKRNQEKNDLQAYYLITDVLLAHIYYSKGNLSEAVKHLENIPQVYTRKIEVLTNFFKGYVIEFKNVVLRSSDDYILRLLDNILITYFH